MTAGLLFGLGAAFAQAMSYLFTRLFLKAGHNSAFHLLVMSHVVMGGLALVLLPWVWPGQPVDPVRVAGPLFWSASCYLVGQAGLFLALQRVEASRISPLLGLKIVVLAVVSVLLLGQTLTAQRWVAVLLCTGAAFLFNRIETGLPWDAWGAIAVAVIGYVFSDLNIYRLVQALAPAGAKAPMLGVCLCYLCCAAVMAPLLVRCRRQRARTWAMSAAQAAAWFSAMCLLFACFAAAGVIFGNIVQATRGLMSIGLGVLAAHAGWLELERRVDRATLWKRVLGGVCMAVAIILYASGA